MLGAFVQIGIRRSAIRWEPSSEQVFSESPSNLLTLVVFLARKVKKKEACTTMFTHTILLKRKGTVVVSTLLFGWMVLNSSTTALADKRRDNWNRRSRFSSSSNCRNDSRRDSGSINGTTITNGTAYRYQRARDYRPQPYYQQYRPSRVRGYNGYQSYNGNWNDRRYRGYDERSTGESALIIAGSTGAGAAVGGLLGGTKGAAIGAIAGGVAGVVYDQHTDNRR